MKLKTINKILGIVKVKLVVEIDVDPETEESRKPTRLYLATDKTMLKRAEASKAAEASQEPEEKPQEMSSTQKGKN
jgi:hypothetical protein